MQNVVCFDISLLLLLLLLLSLLLLQATYLRIAKFNHIGESEARFSRS